jgi:tRNA threonylcarbamoyladenosine biosynthesis protein TsaE
MKKAFTTYSSTQTKNLGKLLALEIHGGQTICLSGDLGSGKTTLAQGVLKGLGAKGPYTSPTFLVMKHYKLKARGPKHKAAAKVPQLPGIYHIDAYRVGAKDILEMGWEEIINDEKSIIIVEWAERIKSIIPKKAVWIKFEHMDKNKRKIFFCNKF